MKTSKRKLERAGGGGGGAKEEVHLSDRLRRMTDGLGRPIRLRTFCLGRLGVSWGFGLREAGAWGVWERAGTCLSIVSLFWRCCLGLSAVWGGSLRGSGGLGSASSYSNCTVEDLSLWGCCEGSVGGQGGGLWGFGLVSRLRFGLVLERQQVGLLLLQALMEALGLALLLELSPLELLLQSECVQCGEKRWQLRVPPLKPFCLQTLVTTFNHFTPQ